MFAPAWCPRISLLQETVMFRELSPSTSLMRTPIFDAAATRPFDMTRGQRAHSVVSSVRGIINHEGSHSRVFFHVPCWHVVPYAVVGRASATKSLHRKGRPGNDPRHGAVVKRARWIAIVSHINPSNSVFVDAPKRVPLARKGGGQRCFPVG